MLSPRRALRRITYSPVVRFTIGATAVAIAVAVVILATDTAAALPTYLDKRPAPGLGAFWAVIALGLGVAFSAALVGVLRHLEQTSNR